MCSCSRHCCWKRPACTRFVSAPRCNVGQGQRVSPDGLSCECAEGWQRESVGKTLRCGRCGAGLVRRGSEADMLQCEVCRSGTYASSSGDACVSCPSGGVDCVGGQLSLRAGQWCETCVEPGGFGSSSSALRRSYDIRQGVLAEGVGQSAQRRLLTSAAIASLPWRLEVSSGFQACQPADACVAVGWAMRACCTVQKANRVCFVGSVHPGGPRRGLTHAACPALMMAVTLL